MLTHNTPQSYELSSPLRPSALKQAWGDFLTELGERIGGWSWWVTLTFRERSAEEIARGWDKVGWRYSQTAFNRFISYLRDSRGIGEPPWAYGREYQTWRGVPHFHALIGGVSHLRRDIAWRWWFNRYGLARIEPYNQERGAGFYLCKYVTKELGDVRVSDHFRCDSRGLDKILEV